MESRSTMWFAHEYEVVVKSDGKIVSGRQQACPITYLIPSPLLVTQIRLHHFKVICAQSCFDARVSIYIYLVNTYRHVGLKKDTIYTLGTLIGATCQDNHGYVRVI